MSKGPGLYSDIGKKARGSLFLTLSPNPIFFFKEILINIVFVVVIADLLYKDYNTDQKFSLTTYSPTGIVSFLFDLHFFSAVKNLFFCFDLLFLFVYLLFEYLGC